MQWTWSHCLGNSTAFLCLLFLSIVCYFTRWLFACKEWRLYLNPRLEMHNLTGRQTWWLFYHELHRALTSHDVIKGILLLYLFNVIHSFPNHPRRRCTVWWATGLFRRVSVRCCFTNVTYVWVCLTRVTLTLLSGLANLEEVENFRLAGLNWRIFGEQVFFGGGVVMPLG